MTPDKIAEMLAAAEKATPATPEDIERVSRLAVERMAGALARSGFDQPPSATQSAWLDGYWAACNLFAGNRAEHDRLRAAVMESGK